MTDATRVAARGKSAGTKIEWTDATWNPVTGCTKVSPGCDHCYAETFAERWRGIPGHPYEQGFDLRLWPERLSMPLHWRKPRRVFVNSMSDLFHDQVPDEFIIKVFDVMTAAYHHTFQVLTKRPGRMASFMLRYLADEFARAAFRHGGMPIPNVWLGTSVESQKWADVRIPKLLECPAAVRFLSCEPLLGPVDLSRAHPGFPYIGSMSWDLLQRNHIDWVIVGGESGPGARPMDLDWAQHLVNQCQAAGVAVFVKQLGARPTRHGRQLRRLSDPKGGDPAEWPVSLRVRQYPDRSPEEG